MPDHREDIEEEELEQIPDFEEKMLVRVNKDFANSIDFLKDRRVEMAERYELYYRGNDYSKLRDEEIYPTDFYADQIDTFTSSMMHPLWAKEEPCKLLPGKTADPALIDAKQALHEYQNREDGLKETHRQLIHDISEDGLGIAKTDYIEKKERVWETIEVPIIEDVESVDELGFPSIQKIQTGTRSVQVPKDVFIYKGPHTERIDPQDFFYTVDKRRNKPGPVMVRTFVSKDFFDERAYFRKLDEIKALDASTEQRYDDDAKHAEAQRRIQKLKTDEAPSKNVLQYVEWQGLVDKAALYEFLGPDIQPDPLTGIPVDLRSLKLVKENEKVMCICGVVESQIVARLEALPFQLDHENIVIGIAAPIGTEIAGNSIGQMLKPAALMMDVLAGIAFKALRASVNRGHAIDVMKIEGGAAGVPDVNQDAWVLNCLGDPNSIHKIIDQPSISTDVFAMMAKVEDWARNRTGIQEISSGRADPDAETLGEVTKVEANVGRRSADPLEMIEETLIIPITRMRDEINMQFLMRGEKPEEYLIEIIGEDGVRSWTPMKPQQIRAHTKFMCEASGRESDRAVITQQLIQAQQIAPNALAAGQAVRLDRGLHDLFTSGFGRSKEEADRWLPGVKIEDEQGSADQMDELMAGNQQMMELIKKMQMEQQLLIGQLFPLGIPQETQNGSDPETSVTSPGQELPQPTNEGDAAQSLLQAASPN